MTTFEQEYENRDPLTDEKGAHPLGAGLGAFAGGTTGLAGSVATGAALGIGGGPVGILAGAAIGGVVGGLLGKGLAEMLLPTEEDTFWRREFREQQYYEAQRSYEDYEPAYRLGYQARLRAPQYSFEDLEAELEREYAAIRREGSPDWEVARSAARGAWERADLRES